MCDISKIKIQKKDNRLVNYDFEKIKTAVKKSSQRVHVNLNADDFNTLNEKILKLIDDKASLIIPVSEMHSYVELALDEINKKVAESYRSYRNYKKDYAEMMNHVLETADSLNLKVDRSNANTNSALISTKRSLIYSALNKELYKKTFLSDTELQAINDGYIYIHDISARLDTYNCCLFDIGKLLQGGFEWEHVGYNEPKTIRAAGAVISDIIVACAGNQYGGFTVPEIDSVLAPYCEKSYKLYYKEYINICSEFTDSNLEAKADKYAMSKVTRDVEQIFQAFEHTFNCLSSSRGDFPFVTITFGCDETKFGNLVVSAILKVRKNGQGFNGETAKNPIKNKRPAIFPKLVFLFTKELHGPGKKMEWLFNEAIECSGEAMYPDYLSLDKADFNDIGVETVNSIVGDIFTKYHKFSVSRWVLDENNMIQENPEWVDAIISPMGCRAYLAPFYKRGGLKPADEHDVPFFHGRFNCGAVSLHLPMIYMKAKEENRSFFEVLYYYLNMINEIHIKTYHYLGKVKASSSPLAYCQGGFAELEMYDDIEPLLKYSTFSYGYTALNELERLHSGKSLAETALDNDCFAKQVLQFISDYVAARKNDFTDGKIPYVAAIYGTPAESLCGTQIKQFRKKYGIIENVSDREYFTNSFHMHVSENITALDKIRLESQFHNISSGGHIQYVRYPNGTNLDAIKYITSIAMKCGLYHGINIQKNYCQTCGTEFDDEHQNCPSCGSNNVTTVNRVCGYLGYSHLNGTSKMNDAKLCEISDRKSM